MAGRGGGGGGGELQHSYGRYILQYFEAFMV